MTNFNFEAVNVPGFFIRHFNFAGELARKDGPLDDYSFALLNRGQGHTAFRSANFPDRFLRHRDFRIFLEPPAGANDEQHRADSTFVFLRGLTGEDETFSFRSLDFPDRFLRHRDFHLFVEAPPAPDDPGFAQDATFRRTLAPVRID
ncbi:MAG: hypothetical protein QOH03_2144 [Kribbellaceae bacterium]|jgi:hypothetical protein|nr:hypothetical protein [Kribbellaceae bacterium]